MRKVIRVIRRTTRRVPVKHQHVKTQEPFEPLLHIDYSNQTPVQKDVSDIPAVKVITVSKTPDKIEQAPRKPSTDYVSLAIKAGKEFNRKTSLEHVNKLAEDLFKFDMDPHVHITMSDVVGQEIFDWIVTLKDRPMPEQKRLKLAQKFLANLASKSSPESA